MDLFRKPLINENRLFRELRERGAKCISCNVSYVCGNQCFSKNLKGELECSSEGDVPQDWSKWRLPNRIEKHLEEISSKWFEISEREGLNSNKAGSLVGNYEDYRVCENKDNAIIHTSFPPDSFVEIGEWNTDPHRFALRFFSDRQYLQNWKKQSTKETTVREFGTYLVRIFRTLFVKTLQSDNFFPEESCFDNLPYAWGKAIEASGNNLMVLLPSRNYLARFEKYKEAFDCSIERHHVIPYDDEIPEAKYGLIFAPSDVHILLYAAYHKYRDGERLTDTHQGCMQTDFHFSHPERIVRFKCPTDEP